MSSVPVLLIAAVNARGYIGANNALMYKLPEDMANFKSMTAGHVVIMGRKTFESMGSKPLPNRINIVVTANYKEYKYSAHEENSVNFLPCVFSAICDAKLYLAKKQQTNPNRKIFIIGGAGVYEAAMRYCDEAVITYVDDDKKGDVLFPVETFKEYFDQTEFDIIYAGETNGFDIEIDHYKKSNQLPTVRPDLLWRFQGAREEINKGTMIGTAGGRSVKVSSIESIEAKEKSPVVEVLTPSRKYTFRFDSEETRDKAFYQLEEIIKQAELGPSL